MVAGAFPLIKLGALLLRQVSKPIVNYTMQKAKSNEFFRKYVCMPPAQSKFLGYMTVIVINSYNF